tara:strand:+ start:408 stop:1871 length:1464 start_codon:yes stop_codon:yes gene_type:complete
MSVSETIVTNRQDPAIESYRLGLLDDVQGFTGGQIFGSNVQNLRNQGLNDQEISDRLSTPATGTEGEDDYDAGRTYSLEDVGGINQNAQYAPPDYQIAGLSPSEQAAIVQAQQNVGSYQPYLTGGNQSIQAGINTTMGAAIPTMEQGVASLYGTGAQFDPTNARNFANQGIAAYGQTTGQYDPSRAIQNTYGAMDDMSQTTGGYDPASAKAYMNEYEDAAVQQALADVARAGQVQQAQLGANAVSSGAFGGARQGIQESELGRNTLMQQGRTAAQMRAAGYESAANRSQQAFEQQMGRGQNAATQRAQMGLAAGQFGNQTFEQAMARRQAAAQNAANLGMSAEQFAASGMENAMARRQAQASGYGSLGQGIGALGSQLGQLGIQQAGLGEMRASLGNADLQNLLGTGALERGNQQAGLDALRLSNLQRYTQPYQQYGFLSDIYSGTPSGSSTLTAASAPQTSPFQSMLGLGVAGLTAASGAQRAGIL